PVACRTRDLRVCARNRTEVDRRDQFAGLHVADGEAPIVCPRDPHTRLSGVDGKGANTGPGQGRPRPDAACAGPQDHTAAGIPASVIAVTVLEDRVVGPLSADLGSDLRAVGGIEYVPGVGARELACGHVDAARAERELIDAVLKLEVVDDAM